MFLMIAIKFKKNDCCVEDTQHALFETPYGAQVPLWVATRNLHDENSTHLSQLVHETVALETFYHSLKRQYHCTCD